MLPNKEHARKRIFFLEGNISSGKTTVIESLRSIGYEVFEEPLKVWQTEYISEGKNILDLFYSDTEKWGFRFEMTSMVTRYHQLMAALNSPAELVFIERSLLTDRYVFALNLYNNKLFSEIDWKIYCEVHKMFSDLIKNILKEATVEYLYIQTPPDECYTRKIGRARAEEDKVTPNYFYQLHDRHEEWLSGGMASDETPLPGEVHNIMGNMSREEVVYQIINILGPKQLVKTFVRMTE